MRTKLAVILLLLILTSTLVLSCTPETKKVGILAALPQELLEIESRISDKKNIQFGEDNFVVGKIGNTPIVATLSGMGKVNAAIAAQRLISNFNASALIFTGVAGGVNPTLEIGDIIIGKQTFQHDVGFLGDSYVRHLPGVLPEIGIGKDGATIMEDITERWPQINGNQNFVLSILEYGKDNPFSFVNVVVNGKDYTPTLKTGVITTGDQFIAQNAKKEELQNLGADVVEMEGAAVAQVAKRNNVPCLIIRSISDKAGSHAQIDFKSFFTATAKNNVLIVDKILNDKQYAKYFNRLLN